MAYTKQVWRDSETGGTPITAARLNHMEDGIEENSQTWGSIYKLVTKQIKPSDINSGRSLYVDTPEIEGYYPISATYARGATQPVCAPSGVVYTPGAAPYIRIINTSATTARVEGTVYFLFIKKDLL